MRNRPESCGAASLLRTQATAHFRSIMSVKKSLSFGRDLRLYDHF